MIVNTDTEYCGIYLTQAGKEYWITDDRGGEEYFSESVPTPEQIEAYVWAYTKLAGLF